MRVGQVKQFVLVFQTKTSTNRAAKNKAKRGGVGTGIGTRIVLRAPFVGGMFHRRRVPVWNKTRGKRHFRWHRGHRTASSDTDDAPNRGIFLESFPDSNAT